MKVIRETVSLCPTCYRRVPAHIGIKDGVVLMKKACFEHGEFEAVVEVDPDFYFQTMIGAGAIVYHGHFIDVTKRCNLKCDVCYFPVDNHSEDLPAKAIYQDALVNDSAGRMILSGGEPLMRTDLPEIIKTLKIRYDVQVVTNGALLNDDNMAEYKDILTNGDKTNINLSLHPEVDAKNRETISCLRGHDVKIESALIVIKDLTGVERAVELARDNKDVFGAVRIKIASNIWNESMVPNKLYVSQVVQRLVDKGAVPVWYRSNKGTYFNIELDGILFVVVGWQTVENIDLLEKQCPPTYTAKTGEVMPISHALIINEGIQKGYLNGVKL